MYIREMLHTTTVVTNVSTRKYLQHSSYQTFSPIFFIKAIKSHAPLYPTSSHCQQSFHHSFYFHATFRYTRQIPKLGINENFLRFTLFSSTQREKRAGEIFPKNSQIRTKYRTSYVLLNSVHYSWSEQHLYTYSPKGTRILNFNISIEKPHKVKCFGEFTLVKLSRTRKFLYFRVCT